MIETIIWSIAASIAGLIIGSFINVLIVRLPAQESINGRSFCRKCKNQLKWYDNIPFFSYLFLGGRCRNCREKISVQYPIVEFLTGCLYLYTYLHFGHTVTTIFVMLIIAVFIAIAFIDYKHLIIYDSFIIVLLIIGVLSMVISTPGFEIQNSAKIWNAVITIVLFLILYLLEKIPNKELIGFGDIKLFFAVGLFVGVFLSFLSVFIAAIAALIVEIIIKHKRKAVIPFGPYLVIGYLVSIFYGQLLIDWYMKFFEI